MFQENNGCWKRKEEPITKPTELRRHKEDNLLSKFHPYIQPKRSANECFGLATMEHSITFSIRQFPTTLIANNLLALRKPALRKPAKAICFHSVVQTFRVNRARKVTKFLRV